MDPAGASANQKIHLLVLGFPSKHEGKSRPKEERGAVEKVRLPAVSVQAKDSVRDRLPSGVSQLSLGLDGGGIG
jgi:hypothetical protein